MGFFGYEAANELDEPVDVEWLFNAGVKAEFLVEAEYVAIAAHSDHGQGRPQVFDFLAETGAAFAGKFEIKQG